MALQLLRPQLVGSDPILVVDDDPACCEAVAAALRGAGYRVEAVCDPVVAGRRVAERSYRLVVSDECMPGIQGMALIACLRRARPELPALLIAAFPDQSTRAKARALGVPLLPKPFKVEALLGAVERLLAGPPAAQA
ncbi:MAG TPA: response regulator [Candidatus Binatia bacterium]|nr:response regulator [Candidatus Binatia bacterium]